MKKSDKTPKQTHRRADPNVMGLHADVVEQNITETLETNYMPYAMSVIVSRAIPEIDGFKPSHRKLLYTMYKMGLLTGARTKSANIVGQTMRLNPHGDAAIYDTMVRLSKGYGALLHPFVDSKGNFGKVYSRDMAWAASRYTEAKLAPICAELFRDIDSDTVDFVDNYDNLMKEPALLPTTFPNILVSANQGIAVGMASQLCGFNLGEVCDTTIAFLKNPEVRISETLLAPDFPTGGEVLYDPRAIEDIYNTGFQQTRAMSAAASGALFGKGAGSGWLHNVFAANTDMVFAMICEELGLIIALCSIAAILVLAFFAVRSASRSRSAFYSIAACATVSMLLVQLSLNVFGSLDILPFTGVTFPFVSRGGTSLLSCWMLMAFIKGSDTRREGSFAVKPVTAESRAEEDEDECEEDDYDEEDAE